MNGCSAPERIRELLGDAFELRFEPGTTTLRMPNGESVWDLFVNGYGPTKALAASIDPEQREQLKRDFIAFHEQYRSDLGIAMPRDYLVTIGYRREPASSTTAWEGHRLRIVGRPN